tara:strand:- start:334 stop:981 length:648 start_codon:yes stop_codon:yes gene_type:complete
MQWSNAQKSRAAWAKLRSSPPTSILTEFNNVKHLVVNHRSSYGNGWQSLTLHGEKPHWTEAINHYPDHENDVDWQYDYHWTEIAEACPVTVNYIKSLPFARLQRVRFMLLRAGGLIDYHRDTHKMNLSPLNVSINMPDQCEFNTYDYLSEQPQKTIPFTDNSAFVVNIGHYHRVINRSNEDRLHMIVHGNYTHDFYNNPANYVEEIDPEFKDLLQ